jgi:16S rRNA processing protein RimM
VPSSAGDRLVVALVRGVHGLRGGLRLEVLTDDPARFEVGSRMYAEGSDKPLTVAWSQLDGPGILLRFSEVPDRSTAETLRDRYLEAAAAPETLPDGSFYWHEVTGVEVSTTTGEPLGRVQDVFRVGESEVFVVGGGQRGELYVPAVSAVVREFAPRDGRIVVDPEALGLDEEPPKPKPKGRRTTRALRAGAADTAQVAAPPESAEPPESADAASSGEGGGAETAERADAAESSEPAESS